MKIIKAAINETGFMKEKEFKREKAQKYGFATAYIAFN